GRSIARELEIDEDLTETLSLAHDLGHTPFGHAGEDALHAAMQPYGGFDHNAQTLRILTELEARYVPFNGLNLTWETLEGLVKHNGPLLGEGKQMGDLPFAIQAYAAHQDLQLGTWPSLEAQIAALSDDIAYNNHDIDDGLRAGLIRLEDLHDLKMTGVILRDIGKKYGDISIDLQRHELVREMISVMIGDLVTETRKRLAEGELKTCDDVRQAGRATAAFSDDLHSDLMEVKSFLMEHVYRHHTVNRSMSKARRIIGEMFELLIREPDLLPEGARLTGKDTQDQARHICDYIAGMTDKYAIEEHHRLFDITDSLA
ncbi:MAG TPA: deoxyguanosinetriphosphate triphosphohydrolase, partial [Rhodobiaceae bacterium]|nr:deoxyguanosinetriphosphate triphosphohydrolase [Rhodobiaceae bacterium]